MTLSSPVVSEGGVNGIPMVLEELDGRVQRWRPVKAPSPAH